MDFYMKYKRKFEYIAANSGFNMSSDNILEAIDYAYILFDTLFIEVYVYCVYQVITDAMVLN